METAILQKLDLESGLRRALDRDELRIRAVAAVGDVDGHLPLLLETSHSPP